MKKFETQTGATLCSSMRPRSATTLWLKFKLLAFAFMALLSINAWGATAHKTLTFPDDNSANNKVQNYTSTWTAKKGTDEWSISNFNNNQWNNSWTYIRCGSKSAASVASIISPKMSVKIGEVSINIEAVNTDNTNSIKLYTSTNKSSWTEIGSFSKETGDQSVEIASTNQAINLYYKIEISCKKSSNGIVQINSVSYFEATASTYTVNFSGQKSGHFQPSFLALSQIVIWGFFAFFCKKVFHIRCTKGAYRMHVGSRPSSQPLFSPFGTLFVPPPFFLIYNVSALFLLTMC